MKFAVLDAYDFIFGALAFILSVAVVFGMAYIAVGCR